MRLVVRLLRSLVAGGVLLFQPGLLGTTATLAAQVPIYSARTCVGHYNEVLIRAKQALASGEPAAALKLLTHAKLVAAQCAELQDEGTPVPIVLACNSPSTRRSSVP